MGLNQDDLADKAGVPSRTYQDYEAGKRSIPSDRLVAIAAALGCSLSDLDPQSDHAKESNHHVTLSDLARGEARILELLNRRLPDNSEVDRLKEENSVLKAKIHSLDGLPEEFWAKWKTADERQRAFSVFLITGQRKFLKGVQQEFVSRMAAALSAYGFLPGQKHRQEK